MIRDQRTLSRLLLVALSLVTLDLSSWRDAAATIDYVSGDVSGVWCADTVMVTDETRVPPGQRLQICAGVEVLFWTHCKLVVDRSATLIAVGTATDSIRFDEYWPGNGWGGIRFMSAADSSRMEFCHLTHGSATGIDNDRRGGAVYCEYSSPVIRRCTIDRCSAAGGGGGIFARFSDLTVEDCVITHCTGLNGGGINCQTGNPQILRNFIQDNSAVDSGGGILTYDCSPTIADNTIQRNGATSEGGGVSCRMGRPRIRHNTISDNTVNGQGWAWGGGAFLASVDSLSELVDNMILRNATNGIDWAVGGGLHCYSAKTILISGNTFEANQTRVAGSYGAATVGAGISCEASVAAIADNRIIGNMAYTAGDFSSWGRGGGIYITSCDSTSTISRNIINDNSIGHGGGAGVSPSWGGGGICCVNSNPEISENRLTGNSGGHSGGGIRCESSNPRILENEFHRNVATEGFGGAIDCVDSSPIIESCVIDSCVAGKSGGGIAANAHPAIRNNTITRCVATENGGGMNLCCSPEPIPEIKGNRIHDNHALTGVGGGIGMYTVVAEVFEGNEISDNTAFVRGGGIFLNTSTPTMSKCTIVNNQAPEGGGLYIEYSDPVGIVNCVLWANEFSQISQSGGTNVQVRYSNVQGIWPGHGVIHGNPLFVDPVATNYRLTRPSPCIDSGDPDPRYLDVDDTRADMGSYSFPIDLGPFELLAPTYNETKYIDLETTFEWTAALPSNPTDRVSGYDLLWWTDGGSALDPETTLTLADTTQAIIPPYGFQPHTTYYWWVRARSTDGRERWARPSAGSMFSEDGLPVLLSAAAIAREDGILVTWRVVGEHGIQAFLVLRRAEKASDWVRISPTLPWVGNEYQYLDDDVDPGVDYEYVIDAMSQDGSLNRFGPFAVELSPPANLTLRLHPNPGRDFLNLAFTLPKTGDVTLRVFDVQGREIAKTAGTGLRAGRHHMDWRPRDVAGRRLPCGVYLVRFEAPSGSRTVRWVVIR